LEKDDEADDGVAIEYDSDDNQDQNGGAHIKTAKKSSKMIAEEEEDEDMMGDEYWALKFSSGLIIFQCFTFVIKNGIHVVVSIISDGSNGGAT